MRPRYLHKRIIAEPATAQGAIAIRIVKLHVHKAYHIPPRENDTDCPPHFVMANARVIVGVFLASCGAHRTARNLSLDFQFRPFRRSHNKGPGLLLIISNAEVLQIIESILREQPSIGERNVPLLQIWPREERFRIERMSEEEEVREHEQVLGEIQILSFIVDLLAHPEDGQLWDAVKLPVLESRLGRYTVWVGGVEDLADYNQVCVYAKSQLGRKIEETEGLLRGRPRAGN